jgi:voltage-gated potassium channel Kch
MKLTLALIGHKDLQSADISTIRASLRRWWSRNITAAQTEPPTLLTCLAPGADQLGAWVLTQTCIPNPAKLRLVFPYDESTYAENLRLQKEEDGPTDRPWSFAALADPEAIKRAVRLKPDWKGTNRDQQTRDCYRAAGRYLAENSDILIALWDGVYVGKTGGTSDTILYALSPECQEKRAREGRRPLKVHWLAIPRRSNRHPSGEAFISQRLSVPSPVVKRFFTGLSAPDGTVPILLSSSLAIASFLCSFLGYTLHLFGAPIAGAAVADKALTAISHLTLNGFDSAVEGPWAPLVRTGRWLAVGFAFTTIGIVMNGLFRWVDDLALRRVRFGPHDLVCGLGQHGLGFIEDSEPSKVPTIAVERTPNGSAKHACARMGVPLVEGDATDPETLRKAGVSRVACAFVVCDTDETNIQVVHQLAKMAHGAQMVCCVGLRSQRNFQILQNALPENHDIDLRIVNAESVTARMFLQQHPIDRFAASPAALGAEVILVGDGPMAEGFLREALQQGVFEDGKELAVACLTSDASSSCRRFTSHYPAFRSIAPASPGNAWLARSRKLWRDEKVLPQVRFFDLPPSDRALLELFEGNQLPRPGGWVTSVIVAIGDPAASASVTYALAPRLEGLRRDETRDITLACYYNAPEDIYRGDIEHALNRDFQSLPVHAFSDFMGTFSRTVVQGEEVDRVARRVHGIYKMPQEQRAQPEFDLSCKSLWPGVLENDKDSNRQAAAHAWVKQRIHARLKARGFDDDAIVDALARIEHRRWCAEYLLKGFRPLTRIPSEHWCFSPSAVEARLLEEWFEDDGQKKNAFKRARRHADLIPFDDFKRLFSADRAKREAEKDLVQIRRLDMLLYEDPESEA